MKMFIVLAAIFQLLVAHTAAENFYIWNTWVEPIVGHGNDILGGQRFAFFHESEVVDCRALLTVDTYPLSDDASSAWVFTCSGEGCLWQKRDPAKMDRLEWHTGWGHFTYYKDRGGKIADPVNREVGTCHPLVEDPVNNYMFNCTWKDSTVADLNGRRRLGAKSFFCEANIW